MYKEERLAAIITSANHSVPGVVSSSAANKATRWDVVSLVILLVSPYRSCTYGLKYARTLGLHFFHSLIFKWRFSWSAWTVPEPSWHCKCGCGYPIDLGRMPCHLDVAGYLAP